jgi:GNAT superfamily N-acetyltransferase
MEPVKLRFREVDETNWADLERLFEARGGPKNCWCMVWRTKGETAHRTDAANRKAGLESRVHRGVPIGILGYRSNEPIGWCSVAPRETYRELGGPEDDESSGSVWSVVCFFVPRKERGRGFFKELLRAAEATARRHGARVLEAYPVDPGSPSYRFMGFVQAFAEAGFVEVGRAGKRRHVMRLDLTRR